MGTVQILPRAPLPSPTPCKMRCLSAFGCRKTPSLTWIHWTLCGMQVWGRLTKGSVDLNTHWRHTVSWKKTCWRNLFWVERKNLNRWKGQKIITTSSDLVFKTLSKTSTTLLTWTRKRERIITTVGAQKKKKKKKKKKPSTTIQHFWGHEMRFSLRCVPRHVEQTDRDLDIAVSASWTKHSKPRHLGVKSFSVVSRHSMYHQSNPQYKMQVQFWRKHLAYPIKPGWWQIDDLLDIAYRPTEDNWARRTKLSKTDENRAMLAKRRNKTGSGIGIERQGY